MPDREFRKSRSDTRDKLRRSRTRSKNNLLDRAGKALSDIPDLGGGESLLD